MMSETSRYLYGDSTPFPLAHNFLILLEEATRACTSLLSADRRLTKAQHAIQLAAGRADSDLQELQTLFASVEQSLQDFLPAETAQTVTEEAAQRLREGGLAAREQIEQQVISWRDTAIRKAENSVGRDRFVQEMSDFLLKTELPETDWQIQWRSMGEEGAEAQSFSQSSIGLKAQYQISIPADSLLLKARRLQNWIETLPVHVEREGRWRKTAKRSVERLEKYFVTALRTDVRGQWLTLHKSLKEGAPGFEFFLPSAVEQQATMRLLELHDEETSVPLDGEDRPGLNLVMQAMEPQLRALKDHRHRLIQVWFHDQELATVTRAGIVAEAIIDQLAVLVRELRGRSSAAGELTLKVEVQDGKREEIFIKEQVITDIYSVLRSPQRQAFDLFALDDEAAADELPERNSGADSDVDKISHNDSDSALSAEEVVSEETNEDAEQAAQVEPEFDYEPMSNPDFSYAPVSDAELDIEELEPLTFSGEEDREDELAPLLQDAAVVTEDATEEPVAEIADAGPSDAGDEAITENSVQVVNVDDAKQLQVPKELSTLAAVPVPDSLAVVSQEAPVLPKPPILPKPPAAHDPVAAMFNDDEILSMGSAGVQTVDDEDKSE